MEIEERWNNYFHLERSTSKRLEQLPAYLNLILPLLGNSLSPAPKKRTSSTKANEESAEDTNWVEIAFVQEVTKGRLGNTMLFIKETSMDAIQQDLYCSDKDLLKKTWDNSQTQLATKEKLLEAI